MHTHLVIFTRRDGTTRQLKLNSAITPVDAVSVMELGRQYDGSNYGGQHITKL